MSLKRFHVGLSAAQTKVLEKLAAKLGLDKTNTMRYCLARTAEQEGVLSERTMEHRPGSRERESKG